MVLTIKNFKVLDTTTGKMAQSGRTQSSTLNIIKSQEAFYDNLVERTAIPGTPTAITGGGLQTIAHMGTTYLQINRSNEINNNIDGVFIPDAIRFTKITGQTKAKLAIIYAFANSENVLPENLVYNVLFANTNEQSIGDFVDIPLPDTTFYPNLYLSLILINDAWTYRTVVDPTQKICSIPGDMDYFCINPSYSNKDVNQSHTVNIQGKNSEISIKSRVVYAFEDWYMNKTDRDYNDIVLSVSSVYIDSLNTNDSSLS